MPFANALRLFKPKRTRRVVYTCMFGFSEPLNDFPIETEPNTDLLCFTDDPELTSRVWRVVYAPYPMLDPVRASKRMKILAHRFLGEYDSSLYIDNTVRLKQPVAGIFEQYLDPSPSPMVCFRHPFRDCIYEEAQEVIRNQFDDAARVETQMAFYRSQGIADHGGLIKGAFLLRRHHDPLLVPVMESWFEQILKHSFRDQLSLPVVVKLMNFSCGFIEKSFVANDLLEWRVFRDGERLPRDFDDVRYLSLHPDVWTAGVNPRKHYMEFGRDEGRSYK